MAVWMEQGPFWVAYASEAGGEIGSVERRIMLYRAYAVGDAACEFYDFEEAQAWVEDGPRRVWERKNGDRLMNALAELA